MPCIERCGRAAISSAIEGSASSATAGARAAMASWYRCGRASRQCGGREQAKRGERNSGGFVTQFTGSVAAKAYPSALATNPRRLNLGKGIHMIDSNTKREMRRLEDQEIDR